MHRRPGWHNEPFYMLGSVRLAIPSAASHTRISARWLSILQRETWTATSNRETLSPGGPADFRKQLTNPFELVHLLQ